ALRDSLGARAVHLGGAGAVLPAQKAARQPVVGNRRETVRLAERRQLALVVALHQVVLVLQRHVAGQLCLPVPRNGVAAQIERLLEPLGRVVGAGGVADLALGDQGAERDQGLLQRRLGIILVGVVEVDAI